MTATKQLYCPGVSGNLSLILQTYQLDVTSWFPELKKHAANKWNAFRQHSSTPSCHLRPFWLDHVQSLPLYSACEYASRLYQSSFVKKYGILMTQLFGLATTLSLYACRCYFHNYTNALQAVVLLVVHHACSGALLWCEIEDLDAFQQVDGLTHEVFWCKVF